MKNNKYNFKASVALCTYNGERYIKQQLQSILNQSVPVDEIVICDDGSKDTTLAIIENITKSAKTEIRIYQNANQIGIRSNFSKAIELCRGDIIFLSDQDDVWLPYKVEKVLLWFTKNPKKEVVFSNASFINDVGASYFPNKTLFDAVSFTRKARFFFALGFELELFLKNGRATGATMAIKKSIKPFIQIKSNCASFHDEIICANAIERKTLGYTNEKLIFYRIHSEQNCGLNNSIVNPPQTANALSPMFVFPYILEHINEKKIKDRGWFMKKRYEALGGDKNINEYIYTIPFRDYYKHYSIFSIVLFIRDRMAFLWRKTNHYKRKIN